MREGGREGEMRMHRAIFTCLLTPVLEVFRVSGDVS